VRKILFPKVKPSVPVKRIREAVKRVVEEAREKVEAASKPASSSHRGS